MTADELWAITDAAAGNRLDWATAFYEQFGTPEEFYNFYKNTDPQQFQDIMTAYSTMMSDTLNNDGSIFDLGDVCSTFMEFMSQPGIGLILGGMTAGGAITGLLEGGLSGMLEGATSWLNELANAGSTLGIADPALTTALDQYSAMEAAGLSSAEATAGGTAGMVDALATSAGGAPLLDPNTFTDLLSDPSTTTTTTTPDATNTTTTPDTTNTTTTPDTTNTTTTPDTTNTTFDPNEGTLPGDTANPTQGMEWSIDPNTGTLTQIPAGSGGTGWLDQLVQQITGSTGGATDQLLSTLSSFLTGSGTGGGGLLDLLNNAYGAYSTWDYANQMEDLLQQGIEAVRWKDPFWDALAKGVGTNGIGGTAYGDAIANNTTRTQAAQGYNFSGNMLTELANSLNDASLDAIKTFDTAARPTQNVYGSMFSDFGPYIAGQNMMTSGAIGNILGGTGSTSGGTSSGGGWDLSSIWNDISNIFSGGGSTSGSTWDNLGWPTGTQSGVYL